MMIVCALVAGCTTMDNADREQKSDPHLEHAHSLEYAPTPKELLFKKAQHYQHERDYTNALFYFLNDKFPNDMVLIKTLGKKPNCC